METSSRSLKLNLGSTSEKGSISHHHYHHVRFLHGTDSLKLKGQQGADKPKPQATNRIEQDLLRLQIELNWIQHKQEPDFLQFQVSCFYYERVLIVIMQCFFQPSLGLSPILFALLAGLRLLRWPLRLLTGPRRRRWWSPRKGWNKNRGEVSTSVRFFFTLKNYAIEIGGGELSIINSHPHYASTIG